MPERICLSDKGKGHKGCPTLTRKEVLAEANKAYAPEDVKEFAYKASLQEAECYANRDQTPYVMQPCKTRMVETCEFALKMGYKRIGLAFCLGLSKEAKTVEEILSGYGFEVVSICCKAGNTSKEIIGISDDEKIFKGTVEAMCNPIFQAKALNHEKVDFNILLGLCVGHDTLFLKFTDTPTTVLAVKDRVTGHNPLAAVYQADSYYKKIRHPDIKS
ncbi:MAG: metal-binding protein [Desulfobacula sp. RIFOXYB2_FULL_45_6]|nr:MAG: metal-binding protein [Desulfobacula sp. RIFOXYB2_FULL_45_6]